MKEDIDIAMVCRICLQASEEEMTHLLESDGTYFIYEKIEKCANLKISNDASLPMRICSKCKVFLSFAFKFYIMCQNSANYLNDFGTNDEEQDEKIFSDYDGNAEFLDDEDECLEDEKLYLQTTEKQRVELENDTLIELADSEDEQNTHAQQHLQWQKEQPSKTLDISTDGAAVIRVKKEVRIASNKDQAKNQMHVCELCGNIYHKKYMLERHMRHHRNEAPFECEICGGKYAYNFQLRRHMNKHSGKRPYVCSYCKRTFTDNSTMRKHERLHRNERPFKCDVCGKAFTYSSVLKAHQQTHTGLKPYICGICNKRFTRGHHLRAHLETQLHAKDPRVETLLKNIRPDELVLAGE